MKDSHESIAVRAYMLWQADGCPAGNDWHYWFLAEYLAKLKRWPGWED